MAVAIPEMAQGTIPCPACGEGEFSAWNGDGWMSEWVVIDHDRLDVDCSGITDECPHCGVELVAKPSAAV